MKRLPLVLAAFFVACWLAAVLNAVEVAPLSGTLDLGLYPLYSLAMLAGSAAGNIYSWRAGRLEPTPRRRLLALCVAGPPGLVTMVRGMAPQAAQDAAPFVPLWAFLVFAIFFLVPLLVRRPS
jgi:hypothetical protein